MNAESDEADLQRRAARFAALGDPIRLAIVERLAVTDCAPSDLEKRLGIRSNLVAHHLDTLEAAGWVERHRSTGDGRRRYVRLVRWNLAEFLRFPLFEATCVLFACRHNSARSQFAMAYWNQRSPIPAVSAGSEPADMVHPGAVNAAARRGLALRGLAPKGYAALDRVPDLVITVCDVALEGELPFPAASRLHWSVPDPASGRDPDAFDSAFDELAARIDRLLPAVTYAEVRLT